MTIVNIHEAKTNFSKIVNKALQGEEIVIARGGKPLIKLTPYVSEEGAETRKGGQFKGLMNISENFDAPLPGDIQKHFDKD